MSHQYDPLIIRYFANGKYYSYDDDLYTNSFPKEWARNHLPGTGPKECKNCKNSGHWNGVFVCYCIKCANVYLGERGEGVIGILLGEEVDDLDSRDAAINTYMDGVMLDDIGDKDFLDSAAVKSMDVKGETLRSITEKKKYNQELHNDLDESEVDVTWELDRLR